MEDIFGRYEIFYWDTRHVSLSDANRRLLYMPNSCSLTEKSHFQEEIDFSFYEIAGHLLAKLSKEPLSQRSNDGNFFFNPEQIFTYEDGFKQLLCAIYHFPEMIFLVDEEMYDYWLGVLPPIRMLFDYKKKNGETIKLDYLTGKGYPLVGGIRRDNKAYIMGVLLKESSMNYQKV